ncbi:MAG TPA: hypothetical protein VFH78_08260 [Candidatus Thermoplasmatota archaeon]|nr:hypothetical protein [Candidatus Thermoplasmatota archaeon]
MLNERFLSRLSDAFPGFYARVDEEARAEADRLRGQTQGDLDKALARARLEGAAKLWWPYVRGSIPMLGREREAMEGFTRLVLTVSHLLGHELPSMEAARVHVVGVLRESLDYERLKDLVDRREKEEAKAAAAGAGVAASVTALMAPLAMARRGWRFARMVPGWGRIAIAAVVVAAAASVPVVATYSAGRKAENAARAGTQPLSQAGPKDDITRAA